MRHLLLVACFSLTALGAFAQEQDAGPAAPEEGVQLFDGGARTDDPLDVLNRMPPDVRQKLTGDQIEQIIRRSQQQRGSPAQIESIVIPTVFFLTIIGVVVIIQYARFRRERQLHETLRAMIEKGIDIPPALLSPPKPKDADRRRGIILLAVGVGLAIFFFAVDKGGDGAWGIGMVPALIGLGYLLAWWLGRRERELE